MIFTSGMGYPWLSTGKSSNFQRAMIEATGSLRTIELQMTTEMMFHSRQACRFYSSKGGH